MKIHMQEIGRIIGNPSPSVVLESEFSPGLIGLEGFGHVMVLWYAEHSDPFPMVFDSPYRSLTGHIGLFATRSPYRPNGICVSIAEVISVKPEEGIIELGWIDAEEGSPVLDVKPYHPSSDRIRDISTPSWCSHWPQWVEDSGEFAWEDEFLF